ncbi:DUF427 domain-containing protein [uncultured Tateyamaria sp.]|uniref:DUF427 domain-containing protein n=1 Tax=uncultured Tateyamaria sp. TaxID=455651 RepID=UPI002621302B|nr:DUF427 domain-containing protein [uncultured Tateyamaria sp.]
MELSRAQLNQIRSKWAPRPSDVVPEPVGDGEESVWDYPRPPAVRREDREICIRFAGVEIARTTAALKVMETAGAPVYYLPTQDVQMQYLHPSGRSSFCEWKGEAQYYDLNAGATVSRHAVFAYPHPLDDLGMGYSQFAGHMSFYADRVDEAIIGGERARPQPGGLYSGWITSWIKGPVKGVPGTGHW